MNWPGHSRHWPGVWDRPCPARKPGSAGNRRVSNWIWQSTMKAWMLICDTCSYDPLICINRQTEWKGLSTFSVYTYRKEFNCQKVSLIKTSPCRYRMQAANRSQINGNIVSLPSATMQPSSITIVRGRNSCTILLVCAETDTLIGKVHTSFMPSPFLPGLKKHIRLL